MQLTRNKIVNLHTGILALKGTTKAVRDKDGNPVMRDGTPLVETIPFSMTSKARYGAGRTLEHIRPIVVSVEEARVGVLVGALREKTIRLRENNPAADAAVRIEETDPEYGPLYKETTDIGKIEEEVTLHQFPIADLKLTDNPDLSPEHLANLLPMLTGEL